MGINRVGSREMAFISHHLCYMASPFPSLSYFKSIPLPGLIEPFWNVPARESRLFSQLRNNNVFTFSWPFPKRPWIHLCFTLHWNKLINVLESGFTADLLKQKAAFLSVKGPDCPRFLYPPRTQGWRICFIITCYWILKHYQVSFLPCCLCFPPEHLQTPCPWQLVITELSGTLFWLFSHIFHLLFLFAFCALTSTLCMWVRFSFTDHIINFQWPISSWNFPFTWSLC